MLHLDIGWHTISQKELFTNGYHGGNRQKILLEIGN